jgi:hypothetical protein
MKRPWISPPGLLVAAAVIGVLYGAVHLMGLRDDACILSGTAPPGGDAGVVLGLVYVGLHFAWVVVAPVCALGAGVLWVLERALPR